MTLRNRKILIVAVTAIQIALFATIFSWRAAVWSEQGWAGLAFQSDPRDDLGKQPEILNFGMFARDWREVIVVIRGSAADAAGIRSGDKIVTVDGIEVSNAGELESLADRSQPGDRLTYVVERGDKSFEATVTLGTAYDSISVRITILLSILLGVAFLSISLLVYWTRPESGRSLVFYLMCTIGAAVFFLGAFSETDINNMRGIYPAGTNLGAFALLLVYALLSLTMTSLILHLSLIFPRGHPVVERWPAVFRWIHSFPFAPLLSFVLMIGAMSLTKPLVARVAVSAAMLWIAGVLARRLRGDDREGSWIRVIGANPLTFQVIVLVALAGVVPWMRLLDDEWRFYLVIAWVLAVMLLGLVTVVGYSLLICLALAQNYRASDVEQKHQIRWPLWGTIIAVGGTALIALVYAIVVNIAPHAVLDHPVVLVCIGVLARLLYLLIPVSFAFGIIKYRLMDIDLIIRKTIVYGGLTGFVIVAYLVLVGLVGVTLISYAGVQSQMVTILSTLIIALLLIPVRNRIQSIVDDRMFRQKHDYEEARRRIRAEVIESGDLGSLLQSIAEQVQQASQTRSVVMFVREREAGRFVALAKVGLPDEIVGRLEFDDDSAIVEHADRIIDPSRDPVEEEERSLFRRAGASLAVLARLKGEPVGIITLGRKLSGAPFDEEDFAFLADVGDQLSLAVGNLQIRPEEVEFAQAREMQRSLLPDEIPQIENLKVAALWLPAREVSGDYYDVLDYEGPKAGVCIGDVVGKGMPAALLMSSLQAAVKAIAPTEAPPDKVCTQVRRVVCQNLTGGKFVTFFYALYDGTTRMLAYTNCGHNPPILVRANGSVERLATGGGAMGRIFADTTLEMGETILGSGDRIVLFTDGVTEARNDDGEEFSEERLVELARTENDLDPRAFIDRVAVVVREFTGGVFQDDFTMVVLRAL